MADKTQKLSSYLKHEQLCIYSILPVCIFKHSDPECQVIACDVTDKYEEFARRFWKKAGVDHLITFRIAPGIKLGISTFRPTIFSYNIHYMNFFYILYILIFSF